MAAEDFEVVTLSEEALQAHDAGNDTPCTTPGYLSMVTTVTVLGYLDTRVSR